MSSTSSKEPVHRLVFDGMILTLHAPGGDGPLARADLASNDGARQVAALSALAEAAPGITVVLPEAEVWRGTVRSTSRTPWGRRSDALVRAEAASGIGRDALEIVVGPPDADGSTPVAAIRRQSVIDALAFLDRAGLRATDLTGAGSFPGFEEAPLFRVGGRDRVSEGFAFVTRHARRLPAVGWPRALAACGVAALLLSALAFSGGEDPELRLGRQRAGGHRSDLPRRGHAGGGARQGLSGGADGAPRATRPSRRPARAGSRRRGRDAAAARPPSRGSG